MTGEQADALLAKHQVWQSRVGILCTIGSGTYTCKPGVYIRDRHIIRHLLMVDHPGLAPVEGNTEYVTCPNCNSIVEIPKAEENAIGHSEKQSSPALGLPSVGAVSNKH